MIREVDDYINASNQWPAEMSALRSVLLGCGLSEAIKWRKPCYVDPNTDANIAIMQEMKGFLALMFFKGSLVDDPESLLEKQGPNSRSAMRLSSPSRPKDWRSDRLPSPSWSPSEGKGLRDR